MYDIMYTIDDNILFEWDDKKARSNVKKHGICFEDAARAFYDQNSIIVFDINHSDHEDRWILLGKYECVILVVYTIREGCIRIISARIAEKEEERTYYGQNY